MPPVTGVPSALQASAMPSMAGRELRHDLRLLRVAEVEAVCCGHRRRTGAGDLARRLRDSVHRAQPGVEITPAAVARERHRQPTFLFSAIRARALDAHHAGLAAWALDGVGLDHGVVLLKDVALVADVGAGQQLLQVRGVVARLLQLFE